ncbi:hypothetical protein B566_EDAN017220 [Ephemera danica]|nr:hypothetical protein B566_EDAN017220 [Ephemera danica]
MSDTEQRSDSVTEVSLQESSSVPELQDVLLEQETQFGVNVEDVTDTSRPVSTALVTSDVEDLEPTPVVQRRHVHMADPETTEFPEETDEEKQERMELVSKQSRPFLLFKCVQWGFAAMIMSLALTTWPVMLLRGNIHLAMQPLVAFVTFLIYCPVVFFGYTFHFNTPAAVMLAMDALGAVYFTFAAIVYGVYWADLEFILSQAPPSTGTPPPVTELEQIKMALEAIGVQNDVHICSDRILMQ